MSRTRPAMQEKKRKKKEKKQKKTVIEQGWDVGSPTSADEAAQGRRTIEILIATMQIPETKKGRDPCFRSPADSKDDPGRNPFHSTVVK